MKGYEELVKLLNKVQATGGLDVDEKSICDYQDMIGHSTQDQLRELANGNLKESFYRVYGHSYGTVEAIRFFTQNSNKMYDLLLERDGLKADLEIANKDIDKYMLESSKNYKAMIQERQEKEQAQDDLKKAQEEIIRLKARLFDLMEK